MVEDRLERFTQWLCQEKMPVFAATVDSLNHLTTHDRTSTTELAQIILRDAAMTAQVLKVANSPYYNQSFSNIKTVTRAVLLMGFDNVRHICVSSRVIDVLLAGAKRTQVTIAMMRAFHSAVQARWVAAKRRDVSPEEVFVAALLSSIGEIAFWCYCDDELAAELEAALNKPGYSRARAEMEVLGFTLQQLSGQLVHRWGMSRLLSGIADGTRPSTWRAKCVCLGTEIARAVEEGWDSERLTTTLQRVSEYMKEPLEEVVEAVEKNAEDAILIAKKHGMGSTESIIPDPVKSVAPDSNSSVEAAIERNQPVDFYHFNSVLQLDILREISKALIDDACDPGFILSTILEGIFRGVGMDRVVLAVLMPDSQSLQVKYILDHTSQQKGSTVCKLLHTAARQNIFSIVLKNQKPLWIKTDSPQALKSLITEECRSVVGDPPFFIAPILVEKRSIGLIQADRKASSRPLDEESYSSFVHFTLQAGLSLSFLHHQRATA